MKVKSESEVAQSYPTLSDPMDCSLPGSSIHRIFQARVLEWGAIAFSQTCVGEPNKTELVSHTKLKINSSIAVLEAMCVNDFKWFVHAKVASVMSDSLQL